MDGNSDRILVQQVQAGDRAAYEILITRYYRRIYGVCLGIITDPHESQDLCQEAMMQGYVKINSLRAAEQFGGWMTKIAKNLCFDWLRKQKKIRTFTTRLADCSDRPDKNDPKNDVAEAVAKLPVEFRMPLTMYYLDGRDCNSISQQLGISHSSVWRRLREAKRCLYQLLNEVKNET